MTEDSLKLNFEIALEKIDSLTNDNHNLMNEIEQLKSEIAKAQQITIKPTSHYDNRFENIIEGADEAMKRYKTYLRKEFPRAKSKQTKRQSV